MGGVGSSWYREVNSIENYCYHLFYFYNLFPQTVLLSNYNIVDYLLIYELHFKNHSPLWYLLFFRFSNHLTIIHAFSKLILSFLCLFFNAIELFFLCCFRLYQLEVVRNNKLRIFEKMLSMCTMPTISYFVSTHVKYFHPLNATIGNWVFWL